MKKNEAQKSLFWNIWWTVGIEGW